ncbi:MAG: hypothetical protein NXH75_15570 [Halobacteriovoraceae bacterium]|nr:hypothetical protein [Halobacteriovoraceae bacterium]
MKIALSCDALVSRNHITSVIETILGVYEDAELYTLVHQVGGILGPIEQRKIHSSYLTNVLTDEQPFGDQWWKKSLLIPGACKNLTIPCNVDILINISSGFSQGIEKCKGVYQITYLIENQFLHRKPKFIREKIFRSYLEHWAEKAIKNCDELWVPTETSREYWAGLHSKVSVLSPFIKATDFPLLPEGIRKTFPKDFFCIDAESFNEDDAFQLIEKCKSHNLKFRFVGLDDHLQNLKRENEDPMFFGSRCSGELAPLLSAARGFISNQRVGFPSHAIESLACGTPIWMPLESEGHEFVKGHGVFGRKLDLDELETVYGEMGKVDPQKVHGQTNAFHDLKFKAEVQRRVKGLEQLASNSCLP